MLTSSFPTPAAALAGGNVSSPPRHVTFQSTVSRTAWTEEERQKRASCVSPHSMASCTTLYEILGIRAAASGEEVKAAYRRLAKMCHPDVARIESSAGEFMRVHAAYLTLSDPKKRASYDRSLLLPQRPLTMSSSSGFSGYNGRNWETDQCW